MTEGRHHPAVFAGLLGSAAWGVPTLALAVSPGEVAEAVQSSLVLQFVIGCTAGAALAGLVTFAVERHARKKDSLPVIEHGEDQWSSSSLNLVRAQIEEDDDPTGDLGRFRTGQITIDFPPVTPKRSASEHRRPRHSASIASAHVNAKSPARRSGRHFAAPERPESLVDNLFGGAAKAAEPARGRHFAGAAASSPRPKRAAHFAKPAAPAHGAHSEGKMQQSDRRRVEEAKPESKASVPAQQDLTEKPELHGRERLATLPVIESRYARPVKASVPVINAKPQEAIVPLQKSSLTSGEKTDQTNRSLGITGRLRLRMRKSVREVLSERLQRDALSGVPIITRADGTTTDINPTWFDQTLVPALASLTGHGKLEDTAERVVTQPKQKTIDVDPADTAERATYISRHVAEVNEGIFPERRTARELEHEDVWEEALVNMSATIAQDTPVFQDMIGGPSTIDDPDGLEAPTSFIPFRVPAAHPEVIDTDTYVDYLLRDELSHNGSQTLRQSSHAHLRVIEGGTNPMRLRKSAGDSGPVRQRGRHFAPPVAQEA